ncbi:hypothetical protein, partial [Vibrio parahaemolyticus]|uniref:hypothetical protein n=1 Tax=Vibrio parahaemolyticus TaxID=670 RepID=UPI000B74FA03
GVCPTACWTFDEAANFLTVQQLVAQINLMLVSCALNTSWGTSVLRSANCEGSGQNFLSDLTKLAFN